MFEINSGIIKKPLKVVIYGTEGVGKTSLASQFPNPIFIDTEGGTKGFNVSRYPDPTSWEMLIGEVQDFLQNTRSFKTLVIDSIDWAEAKAIERVCATAKVNGIEDIGWSKGYTYVHEDMGRLLNLLTEVINRGINVVLVAHMVIRTITKPEETGSYDRYELKLKQAKNGNNCQLVKEWADMVLFCNFKEFLIGDGKSSKKKATGGKERVMYTQHAATWDAKNRYSLPEQLPLDFSSIAHLFTGDFQQPEVMETKPQETVAPIQEAIPVQETNKIEPATQFPDLQGWKPTPYTQEEIDLMNKLPKQLSDLMKSQSVHPSEIQNAVSLKGYFPKDTPIENYPMDFVEGCLIGAWTQVFQMIEQDRELPF